MNIIAIMPDVASSSVVSVPVIVPYADPGEADRDLAIAWESDIAHWYAASVADDADFTAVPRAIRPVQADFDLEIPGAPRFCKGCMQPYPVEAIDQMRQLVRYKKNRSRKIARMREIIAAFDAYDLTGRNLQAAKDAAHKAANDTSERHREVVKRIGSSNFETPVGLAVHALALLSTMAGDILESEAFAAYYGILRSIGKQFPALKSPAALEASEKTARLHPTL